MSAADTHDSRSYREYLLLFGFVLLCIASVFTVLLPETQNEDEPGAKSGAQQRAEASPAAPRP